MPDIAAIGTVLSSVKAATDLAKLIKNSDLSLSEAETKLRIAELISALADVKLELAEVQQILVEKDSKISELEKTISNREALTFDGKLYWAEADTVPLCPVCYEKEGKHYHLTYYAEERFSSEHYHCRICTNDFYTRT